MYPLHLNYITTLPCRTITTKITIFIIVLVLKSKTWKFDISDCHILLTVQNHAKAVYFKTCSKCPLPQAVTQARSLLTKLSMALLMAFCCRSSHVVCKTLQLVDGIRLGLKYLVAFKHSSPDILIKSNKAC